MAPEDIKIKKDAGATEETTPNIQESRSTNHANPAAVKTFRPASAGKEFSTTDGRSEFKMCGSQASC
jgi:hypothetical protein